MIMKARITSLLFVAMLFSTIAFAQPKNVARLGLFSFTQGQFNVSYERVLGDNASVGLYACYVYKGLGAAFDRVVDAVELSGNIANNSNAPVQLGFDDLLGPLGEIEGNIPGIPEALLRAETSATSTSATFEMKHVVAILPIRFGLSIGYAF